MYRLWLEANELFHFFVHSSLSGSGLYNHCHRFCIIVNNVVVKQVFTNYESVNLVESFARVTYRKSQRSLLNWEQNSINSLQSLLLHRKAGSKPASNLHSRRFQYSYFYAPLSCFRPTECAKNWHKYISQRSNPNLRHRILS